MKAPKIISMHDALVWLQQPGVTPRQPVDITIVRATRQTGRRGEILHFRGVTALEGHFRAGIHRVRFPNGQIRAFHWWQLIRINDHKIYL